MTHQCPWCGDPTRADVYPLDLDGWGLIFGECSCGAVAHDVLISEDGWRTVAVCQGCGVERDMTWGPRGVTR